MGRMMVGRIGNVSKPSSTAAFRSPDGGSWLRHTEAGEPLPGFPRVKPGDGSAGRMRSALGFVRMSLLGQAGTDRALVFDPPAGAA